MLIIGILCAVALILLFLWCLFTVSRECDEEHDDGIVRALQDWPEVFSVLKPQGYCPAPLHFRVADRAPFIEPVPVAVENVPAVFRSRRRRPFAFGGNAHQRRILRRWENGADLKRAAA